MTDKKSALINFWSGMGKLSILGTLYALAMADDEDYMNQPSYIRASNFLIPTGDGNPSFRIRLPADIALLTKMLPETIIMNSMVEDADSKKFARELASATSDALLGPNMYPQIIKPITEVALNRSFFTGAPIVGLREENLETQEQYRDNTSEIAKLFGHIGISPLKADYFARSLFGYAGSNMLTLTDVAIEAATGDFKATREFADFPLGRTFFARTQGTGFKTDFYALRDDLRKVVGSLNLVREQGDTERAQELIEDNAQLLRVRRQVNRLENTINKSNRRIRKINDSNLPNDEKRRRIEAEEALQARLAPQIRRVRSIAYDQ
jgi:hypothetical protein